MMSVDKTKPMTIGRLAEAAGVKLATVLYYQRRGLLPRPKKPNAGGFSVYGKETLERILQIKRAKKLGFTLAEILKLLVYLDQQNCDGIRSLVKEKLEALRVHIREQQKVLKTLTILVEDCRKSCPEKCLDFCPILKGLGDSMRNQVLRR